MDKNNQDLNLHEVSVIEKTFSSIEDNIKRELNERAINYNTSILYRNYSNLFYFIPKHCFLEVTGVNNYGYQIMPDQPFFVKENKKGNSLKYTTKLKTNIIPIDKMVTIFKNKSFVIDMEFHEYLEYDTITLWISPNFVKKDKLLACSIIRKILAKNNLEIFAEVTYEDGTKAKKPIKTTNLDYQLKTMDINALSYHYPQMTCGFNLHLDDFFDHNYGKIKKATFYLTDLCIDIIEDDIAELFSINMLPIFNIYDGYSYTTNVDLFFSKVKLKNEKNKYAIPLYVSSIYENNEKVKLDANTFKGQNEYYFNVPQQELNYYIQLPDLFTDIKSIKIYTYASWTDNIDISDNITVDSNDLSSVGYKVTPVNIEKEKNNYHYSTKSIFLLIEKLNTNKIFTKSTIECILMLLQINDNEIKLLQSLIESIEYNSFEKKLYLTIDYNYYEQHYIFIENIMEAVCRFLRENTYIHIEDFILNKN
jgi:hypothetical protein